MISLARYWILVVAISVVLWMILKISKREIPFYWVFLWVLLGVMCALGALWVLSLLTGNSLMLF